MPNAPLKRFAIVPTERMEGPHKNFSRYARDGENGPDIGLYLQALADEGTEWFEAQKSASKLALSEHVSKLSAALMYGVVMGLILATVLVLWFVGLALWLGQRLGDMALGFVAAGGLFALLGVLFYLVWRFFLREKVMLAIINSMHATN